MGGISDIPPDLADRFLGRLRVFATRRLGDPAAAEDVAQETLRRIVVVLREDRLENPEALPAFVFQTARHVCQHHLRGAARRDRAMARLVREDGPSPDAIDPLTRIIRKERRREVRGALDSLAPEDREILELFFDRDMETGAIASTLGLDPGAVRVRKHRALRRLEQRLTDVTDRNESTTSGT